MTLTQNLTFQFSALTLLVAAIVLPVAAGLCFLAWRRSGYHRGVAALEGLRFALITALVAIFNQPEWIEQYRPEEQPTIAVLWDASPSMNTPDVVRADAPSMPPISRREAIANLVDESTWNPLREKVNVVVQSFATEEGDATSNLYQPLHEALEKYRNLRGVVLISDGDWNDGPPPVDAATRLRLKGVPIFGVPVGSTTRIPDLQLLSLDVPTFGVAGKSVRIPFTIDSSLPREHTTSVILRSSDGDEVTKEVTIAAMGRTSDAVIWRPKSKGDFTLTLEIPKQLDERDDSNNRLSAPIAIRDEKLRVLVVESYPRWEYRYLRNALSRDPGVDVACLLFHPGLSKPGGGNADYIKEFPKGLEELSKFDVVFLGDVGVEQGQLTVEQCRLLRGLVEHQASGLVFMPGLYGKQFSLLDTDLGELYPVILDPLQPGGWGSRTPSHFELTEMGRRSLLTKLADTQDDNIDVWENLPGFQWYAPVMRAKAGTDVLCVHKDATNEYGRLPLLVTRTFGAGKVLFMGTDGAWRWRKGVEDKYHYRFWGQVVRWMAYARNMAKGETMRLFYSPDQPLLRQNVIFHANVMETSGEPVQNGDVTARIVAPSGKASTIRFLAAGDEWGAYTGRFTSEEPGEHHVTLVCQQTKATLETTFFVQGRLGERAGQPARPEVLDELARVSGGKVLPSDQAAEIVQVLAALPEPPAAVRRLQLWSHPALAGILILLFGVFWVGRKLVGLI